MKILFKKFNSQILSNQTIGTLTVSPEMVVDRLKEKLRNSLRIDGFFQLEGYVCGVKVLLTESFPLKFYFQDQEKVILFIESPINPRRKAQFKKSLLPSLQKQIISNNTNQFSHLISQYSLSCEDLDKKTELNGWKLLHYSSLYGSDEILKLLLQLGCNSNAESEDNWTPLMLASAHCRVSCVSILIKHPQIQINKVTKRGSALHVAVEYNHLEIVSLLLNARAFCNIENLNGLIPLQLAFDEDIIQLIPKYQGYWELEKYKTKNCSVMMSGEVVEYCEFTVNDKHSFLVINVENGFLGIFNSRESWVKKRPPREALRIVDIQLVDLTPKKIPAFEDKFFFRLVYKEGTKIFFANSEKLRNEWMQNIMDSVKYCQLHKIGVENNLVNVINEEILNRDIDLDSFKIVDEIGSGSFGTVFKVVKKNDNKVYAMKKLSKKLLMKKKMLKYAISECKIMKDLHHPFVLELFYCFENSNYIFLILEYCPGGDLESLLESKPMLESAAKFYLAEIIIGIEYLHSHNIIYRDLKPANILLDEDGHIKLADFGIAKSGNSKEEAVSTLIGSPAYISPEVLCYEKLSKASDIYSLGIVMHELLTGIVPFSDYQIDRIFNCIKTSDFEISENLNAHARDLILRLLTRDTQTRPSLQDIKRHPFFKNVNWNFVKTKKYNSIDFI